MRIFGTDFYSSFMGACNFTKTWMENCNTIRPHESLHGFPPYSIVEEKTMKVSTTKCLKIWCVC